MKIKPDTPEDSRLTLQQNTTCLFVMRLPEPFPRKPMTASHTTVSNTVRATTITVVLEDEEILTDKGYLHGGINE
jgi:hypothetical protein